METQQQDLTHVHAGARVPQGLAHGLGPQAPRGHVESCSRRCSPHRDSSARRSIGDGDRGCRGRVDGGGQPGTGSCGPVTCPALCGQSRGPEAGQAPQPAPELRQAKAPPGSEGSQCV